MQWFVPITSWQDLITATICAPHTMHSARNFDDNDWLTETPLSLTEGISISHWQKFPVSLPWLHCQMQHYQDSGKHIGWMYDQIQLKYVPQFWLVPLLVSDRQLIWRPWHNRLGCNITNSLLDWMKHACDTTNMVTASYSFTTSVCH